MDQQAKISQIVKIQQLKLLKQFNQIQIGINLGTLSFCVESLSSLFRCFPRDEFSLERAGSLGKTLTLDEIQTLLMVGARGSQSKILTLNDILALLMVQHGVDCGSPAPRAACRAGA